MSATETTSAAAEESSAKTNDKAARPTADGIYISKEGLLKVPEEITLKDVKATVSKTRIDEDYRIEAVTGDIGGRTYTIRETGVAPASYVRVLYDHDNSYMLGFSGHAIVAELHEDCSADYVVNISSDQCILLKVIPNGLDEKEAAKIYKKEADATGDLYDELIKDFINASEISWE